MKTVEERFWAKVRKPDQWTEEACWEWTGSQITNGYGNFRLHGSNKMAHRVAYVLCVGKIPEGLVIDHLCRNHGCVNPNHLEPATNRENFLRGVARERWLAKHLARTHCKRGHPFSGDNLSFKPQPRNSRLVRVCVACAHMRSLSRSNPRLLYE